MTLLGLPAAQLVPALALGSGVLVALYLLKQQRRRVPVPFARLWQRVLRESESSALQRQLKRLLSLLVQLVLLMLLVLALGDPRLSQSRAGRTLVLLVDTSASMQARTLAKERPTETRLDVARQKASEILRALSGDDLAVVVALSGEPAPLGGLTQDEEDLRGQLAALAPREEPADLPRALRLSQDLLAGRPNPQIVLISDGSFDADGQAALAAEKNAPALRFQPLPLPPQTQGNLAVTAFAVRRYRQNRLSYEVLVEATAFPPPEGSNSAAPPKEAIDATLELVQEGEVVDVQKLTLKPGERVQRIYPNLAGSGARLQARLRRASGADLLPLDDVAYALLPERRRQRVLLVTRGNLFLEGALLSTGASTDGEVQVERMTPERFAALTDAQRATYDAAIFDGYTPERPVDLNAVYIDPQGPSSPFESAETVAAPLVTDVAKDHPLLRWVTLKDLNISRATVFRLEPGDTALASLLRKPLLVARERPLRPGGPPRRVLAIGFDTRRSDLPLRVAFPVLLVNALDWFAGDAAEDPQSFATGVPWSIPLPALRGKNASETNRAQLTLPDGRSLAVPVYGGAARHHGSQVGFYSLALPGAASASNQRPLLLCGNLRSEVESAARLLRELRPGGDGQPALAAPEAGRGAVKRALWPYLLAAALALLFIEWLTYHRRWTV